MIDEVAQQETPAEADKVEVRRAGAAPDAHGGNGDSGENRRLSSAEKRLMRVLVDPQHHALTHRDKAKVAHVSESRYYQIIADPWFKNQERELMLSHMHGELAPIVKACIDTAKKPGRDGFNDRRMALEVMDIYQPRSTVDHNVKGQMIVGVVGISPDQL